MEATEKRAILCRGGYHGRKIHRAYAGATTTNCGHWMREHADRLAVGAGDAATRAKYAKHLCERCFGIQRQAE